VKEPKSLPGATKLLERFAAIEGQLELIEATRSEAITNANASADAEAAPLLKERSDIIPLLASWWSLVGPLVAGSKKSMELGGCKIGSRMSRPKLAHGFENDAKATEALRSTRWARQTTRVTYSLDRTGTLKLLQLGGKAADVVASLGFSIEQGERFFVERSA
jgi:hypothetical protein